MKELEFCEALGILSKLPAAEVDVLVQESEDYLLLAHALADVLTLDLLGLAIGKDLLFTGIMQSAYYLGYRRAKNERQMPEFIVGGPNENQETR